MTSYLVDTNLVSELRKKGRCDRNVAAWQLGVAGQAIYISVISMMEIKRGILIARRKNPALSELLEEWYDGHLKTTFEGYVIPVDLAVSERCSALLAARTRDVSDALIAATAHVKGLTLATRNTVDFTDTGVKLVNPWEAS